MTKYQLIIIGAGSGGLVAAEVAAKLGVKVALIEAEPRLGGECLHAGCVPSKALIHAARVAWEAGHNAALGVHAEPRIDFGQVMRHVTNSMSTIERDHDNDAHYEKLGVDVIHGPASFVDDHVVEVGGAQYHAKKFIIATGSRPATPDIAGLQDGPYLTNETVFEMTELPESMIVIGGGPIGCELGQSYAMLGSKVTIMQHASRLLPREEPEASAMLLDSLVTMGVEVQLDSRIEQIAYSPDGVSVLVAGGEKITAAKLLLATGRTPNLPAGLDKAGVNTTTRGITVNNKLQTSAKHIYAVGDCNGGMQFTHAAGQQAAVAVQNAALGLHKVYDSSYIPWTTFTTPEIGHVGATKAELDGKRVKYEVALLDFKTIDKAITENETGRIEILIGNKSKILGATVVGANAAEILAQIVISKTWNNLGGMVQTYPTYGGALWQAAAKSGLEHVMNNTVGKLIRGYIRLRN